MPLCRSFAVLALAAFPAAVAAQATEPALDPIPGQDGGPVEVVDVEVGDDLPSPRKAAAEAGEDGDRVVGMAGGDPYFVSYTAGSFRPPPDERLDPTLVASAWLDPSDARPVRESYAFAIMARRITEARVAALEALGARCVGFRPHQALAVAVPRDALDAIAASDSVRWLGRVPAQLKVHPALAARASAARASDLLHVWVSVFESDVGPSTEIERFGEVQAVGPGAAVPSPENPDPRPFRTRTNGWQERALGSLGVTVLDYSDLTRAFLVEAWPGAIETLADLDFVEAIDLRAEVETAHDESTPMIHADYGRAFATGGTNQVAIAGQVDSGYHFAHWDLDHIWGVGWNVAGGSGGPWVDACWHGSHVAGTILGTGDTDQGLRGNAPGLGWGGTGRYFQIRFDGDTCASGHNLWTTDDLINILRQPAFSTPRPHVINNSWGQGGFWFDGTDHDAVALDTTTWNDDQLWIFAAGNEGPGAGSVRSHGCAKNVLTVGSVKDFMEAGLEPGEVVDGSSRGPTGDGRWKPNVCAPGWQITSVLTNTTTGYTTAGGTSMATPHVTGVAAQLVDAYAFLRYAPARLSSLLMATALTRNDQTLTTPGDSHLLAYGTGRVDAMRAMHATSQFGWQNWGFTLNAGQATYADFTVGAGATRLVVCMHYVEPAAAENSGRALVSDWDLFLDEPPIDPALNTGDWFAQQSGNDNTEIRILNFPNPGTWRWKVWPYATVASAKFGITVSVVYADTTPDGTLALSTDKAYAQPGETVELTGSVSNPDWIASAVVLDTTNSSGSSLLGSTTTLLDGRVTGLIDNPYGGYDVLLGNIRAGTSRSARWQARWWTEGWKTWSVTARSENWVDEQASIQVGIDGTAPATPSGLASATHTVNVWSNLPDVYVYWNAPSDNLSGVAGYSWLRTQGGPGAPGTTLQLTTPFLWATLPSTASGWWINVRAVDQANNWSGTGSIGPFQIDTTPPTGPSNLASSTHYVSVPSCSTTVNVQWTSASDAHSGLAGYVGLWDASPSTEPTGADNLTAGATSYTSNIGSSPSARYFHIRARDNAGNLGNTAHFGPIYADASSVWTYCTGKTNSLGCVPSIGWSGQPSLGGSFTVTCSNAISQKNGLLYWGLQSAAYPFQGGWQCVSAPFVRTYIQSSGGSASGADCTGSYAFAFDPSYLYAYGLMPGAIVYCQWWLRDPAVASTTGLSNALRFGVCE